MVGIGNSLGEFLAEPGSDGGIGENVEGSNC